MPAAVGKAAGDLITPAAQLLLEDQLKRILDPRGARRAKQSGLLPKSAASPFGEFPTQERRPAHVVYREKNGMHSPQASPLPSPRQSMTPRHTPRREFAKTDQQVKMKGSASQGFLRKGEGLGGLTSSTFVGREEKPSKPPKAGAYRARKISDTEFRRFYDRGDLPIQIHHGGTGNRISWKVDIDKLDYHHYLPIFFDGLREKEDPYRFLAVQSCYDLLEKGGSKILPVVPQLIIPIKTGLNTRDPEVVATTLKVLQYLVQPTTCEMVGEAMVPYYRQILPVFNIFKTARLNVGDSMDYGQRKRNNLGELVMETLEAFEQHGGEDAFINIKYMVPTYESCEAS
jgi:hypothetical protein